MATDSCCLVPVSTCFISGIPRLPLISVCAIQSRNDLKCAFSLTFSGAKYSLLAYTTLGLESAEDSFRTHNLTIAGNGKYIWYQFKEIKTQ